MNAKQRRQNRATAKDLHRAIINNSVCPECGEKGVHWAPFPMSLEDLFSTLEMPQGIWLCDKFYGPDGRRIETRTGTGFVEAVSKRAEADGWTADAILKGPDMEIKLPFAGFYGSIWSDALDRAEEMEVEALAEDYDVDNIARVVYDIAKHHESFVALAKAYVPAFQEWLRYELDVVVTLRFVEMTSPKEYNFTTDAIYATISYDDAVKLAAAVPLPDLQAMAKAQFTSRDGFISFYSPDIEEWGEIEEWDYNQLGTLLEALVKGTEYEMNLLEGLWEDIDRAFSECVDWDHVHHALGCLAEGREDDWKDFPRGITEAKPYVEKMAEIRHLK